jgi:hypothetical protein|tara:strand:- start:430 stop:1023 length:594 start_codon:yes stop_codon:yes gene_type:complete
MATSDVEICNLALTHLGEDSITALTENSKAGRLCNLNYVRLRNATLRSHTWNFAVKRAQLALSTSTPEYEYAYAFTLPTDYIRIVDTDLLNGSMWKVENGKILCDSSALKIRYIFEVTDPNSFDEMFIETFSYRIAQQLAISLSDSVKLSETMERQYNRTLRLARNAGANEGNPEVLDASSWLNSRVSYTTPYVVDN